MGVSAAVLALLAWLFSILLGSGCVTGRPDPVTNGVPNLSQVEPGIWRGGQPKSPAAWSYLRSLGLTNDIKLNTIEEASDEPAAHAGFGIFYFPIDTMQQLVEGPDRQVVSNALVCLRPGTFVHCEYGHDRTGLLVALYRLQEGTNAAWAWQEMTNHGYHPALLGLTHFWREAAEAARRP